MRHYIPLALLLVLSACGTRGGLYMPGGGGYPNPIPAGAPPPLFGNPAPAKPAQPKTSEPTDAQAPQGAGDINTAKEPQK